MADNSNLSLQIRSDSQDAWLFQAPLNRSVEALSDFFLGLPRCDNRLAAILEEAGHLPQNPAFAIHAIEIESTDDSVLLYGTKGSVFHGDNKNVLLSDRHIF